jgi:glycosyltransferase involved in cell wall biosynthesis
MHVVTVNYCYDRGLNSVDELLTRYGTLSGWAEGLSLAGAAVTVVQRFSRDVSLDRANVYYRFVRDPALRQGSVLDRASRVNRTVADLKPDVVHVNGLFFARQACRLVRRLPKAVILVQDHAGDPPQAGWRRESLRRALRRCRAVSFAACELAKPWIDASLISADMPVVELMEGSSRFRRQDRATARAATGLSGDPLCLWVGRLNANKDPLTVLQGFAAVLDRLPNARLLMAYGEADLLPDVKAWLAAHPAASLRVTLLGNVSHASLEALYNSADFLLQGSHHEGSGYAVLEAMACGVAPIVTDIPSFRRLLGDGEVGGLWPVGDSGALERTLLEWHARLTLETPRKVRRFFEERWTFEAIGREAFATYADLMKGATR